jgi:hypothetical protein
MNSHIISLIPAEAGTQFFCIPERLSWISASAGMSGCWVVP